MRLPGPLVRLMAGVAGLLTGCAPIDYDQVSDRGRFAGGLFVMWIGESPGPLGDGRFVFVPNPDDRLRFTRVDAAGQEIGPTFMPEMMYTDGGSIPRIASAFRGLQPWGYAPAYMVHDWLFIARNCVTDGTANAEQRKVAQLSFRDSALIIAEAIKALQASGRVRPDDVSPFVISTAVTGPISRRAWDRRGACAGHTVSEEDRAAAEAAFPPTVRSAARPRLQGLTRTLPSGETAPLRPATLVGQVGF